MTKIYHYHNPGIDISRNRVGQFKKIGFFKRTWNWFVDTTIKIGLITFGVLVLIGIAYIGSFLFPQVKEVEAIKEVEAKAPIMDRIAKCESGGKQLDTNGQVLMRSNTNKSVDVGKFQINSVHFAEATKLGFDLTTESGNEGYANYLYKNRGTGDWSSSAKCWNN